MSDKYGSAIGRGGYDPTGANKKVYERIKKRRKKDPLYAQGALSEEKFLHHGQVAPSDTKVSPLKPLIRTDFSAVGGVSPDKIAKSIYAADAAWREKTGMSMSPEMMMYILQTYQSPPDTKEEWLAIMGIGPEGPLVDQIRPNQVMGENGMPIKTYGKLTSMFSMTGVDVTPAMLGDSFKARSFTEEGAADWIRDVAPLPQEGRFKQTLKKLDQKVRFNLEELPVSAQRAYNVINYGIIEWKRQWKQTLKDRGIPDEQLTWDENSAEWNEDFDKQYHAYLLGRIIPYTMQNTNEQKREQAQLLLDELIPGYLDQKRTADNPTEVDVRITDDYLTEVFTALGGPQYGDNAALEVMYRGWIDGRLPGQTVRKARWDYAHEFGMDFLPNHVYRECVNELSTAEGLVNGIFGKIGEIMEAPYKYTPWDMLFNKLSDQPGGLGDFFEGVDKVAKFLTFDIPSGMAIFEGFAKAEHGVVTLEDVLHDLVETEQGLMGLVNGSQWEESWDETEGKHFLRHSVDLASDHWGFDPNNRYLRMGVWMADLGLDLWVAGKIQHGVGKGMARGGGRAFKFTSKSLGYENLTKRGGTFGNLVRGILYKSQKKAQDISAEERLATERAAAAYAQEELIAIRASHGEKIFDGDFDPATGAELPITKTERAVAERVKKRREADKVGLRGRTKPITRKGHSGKTRTELTGKLKDEAKGTKPADKGGKKKAADYEKEINEELAAAAAEAVASEKAGEAAPADDFMAGVVDDAAKQAQQAADENQPLTSVTDTIDDTAKPKAEEPTAPEGTTGEIPGQTSVDEALAGMPEDVVGDAAKPLDALAEEAAAEIKPANKRASFGRTSPKKDGEKVLADLGNGFEVWISQYTEAGTGASRFSADIVVSGTAEVVGNIADGTKFNDVKRAAKQSIRSGEVDTKIRESGMRPEEKGEIDAPEYDERPSASIRFLEELRKRNQSDEFDIFEAVEVGEEIDALVQDTMAYEALARADVFAGMPELDVATKPLIVPGETVRDMPNGQRVVVKNQLSPEDILYNQEVEAARAAVHNRLHGTEYIQEIIDRMSKATEFLSVKTSYSPEVKRLYTKQLLKDLEKIASIYHYDYARILDQLRKRLEDQTVVRKRIDSMDTYVEPYSAEHFNAEISQLVNDMVDIDHFRLDAQLPSEIVDLFLRSENPEQALAMDLLQRRKQTTELNIEGIWTDAVRGGRSNLGGRKDRFKVFDSEYLKAQVKIYYERKLLPAKLQALRDAREPNIERELAFAAAVETARRADWVREGFGFKPITARENKLIASYRDIYDMDKPSSLISRVHRAMKQGDWQAINGPLRSEAIWELTYIREITPEERLKLMNSDRSYRQRHEQMKAAPRPGVYPPERPTGEFKPVKPWRSAKAVIMPDDAARLEAIDARIKHLDTQRRQAARRVNTTDVRFAKVDYPEKIRNLELQQEGNRKALRSARRSKTQDPKKIRELEARRDRLKRQHAELLKEAEAYAQQEAKNLRGAHTSFTKMDGDYYPYSEVNVRSFDTRISALRDLKARVQEGLEIDDKILENEIAAAIAEEEGFCRIGEGIEFKKAVRLDTTAAPVSHVIHLYGTVVGYILHPKTRQILGYEVKPTNGKQYWKYADTKAQRKRLYDGSHLPDGTMVTEKIYSDLELGVEGQAGGLAHPAIGGWGKVFKVVDPEAAYEIEFAEPVRIPRRTRLEYAQSISEDGNITGNEYAVTYELGNKGDSPQTGKLYQLGEPNMHLETLGRPLAAFQIKARKILRLSGIKSETSLFGRYEYWNPDSRTTEPAGVVETVIINKLGEKKFKQLTRKKAQDIIEIAREQVAIDKMPLDGYVAESWGQAMRALAVELLLKDGEEAAVFDIGSPNKGNQILIAKTRILAPLVRRKRMKEGVTVYDATVGGFVKTSRAKALELTDWTEDGLTSWREAYAKTSNKKKTGVKSETTRHRPFFKESLIEENMAVAEVVAKAVEVTDLRLGRMTLSQKLKELKQSIARKDELVANKESWTPIDEFDAKVFEIQIQRIIESLEENKVDIRSIDLSVEGFNLGQAKIMWLMRNLKGKALTKFIEERKLIDEDFAKHEKAYRDRLEEIKKQEAEELKKAGPEKDEQWEKEFKEAQERGLYEGLNLDEFVDEMRRSEGFFEEGEISLAEFRKMKEEAAASGESPSTPEVMDISFTSEGWPFNEYDFSGRPLGRFIPTTPDQLSRGDRAYMFDTRIRSERRMAAEQMGDIEGSVGSVIAEATPEGILYGKVAGLARNNAGKLRPLFAHEFKKGMYGFQTYEAYTKAFIRRADSLVRTGRKHADDFIIPRGTRRRVDRALGLGEVEADRRFQLGRYWNKRLAPEPVSDAVKVEEGTAALNRGDLAVGETLAGPKTTEGFLKKAEQKAPALVRKEHMDEAMLSGIEMTYDELGFSPEHLEFLKNMAKGYGIEYDIRGSKKIKFDEVEYEVPEYFTFSGETEAMSAFLKKAWTWQPDPVVPSLRSIPSVMKTKAQIIAEDVKYGQNRGNFIRLLLGLPDTEAAPELVPYITRLEKTRYVSGRAERGGRYANEGVLDILAEMEQDEKFKALFPINDKDMRPGLIDPLSSGFFSAARIMAFEGVFDWLQVLPPGLRYTAEETLRIVGTPIQLERSLPMYNKPDAIRHIARSTKMGRKRWDATAREQALRHEQAMLMAANDPRKIRQAIESLERDLRYNLDERGLLQDFEKFAETVNRRRAGWYVKINTELSRAYEEVFKAGEKEYTDRVVPAGFRERAHRELASMQAHLREMELRGDKEGAAMLRERIRAGAKRANEASKKVTQWLDKKSKGQDVPRKLQDEVDKILHSEPVYEFQFASDFTTEMNMRYLAWFQSGRPVSFWMKTYDSAFQDHWMRFFKQMVMGTLAFPVRVMAGDEFWRIPMEGIIPGSKRWREARQRAMMMRGGVDPEYLFGVIKLDKTLLTKKQRDRYHDIESRMPDIMKQLDEEKKALEELALKHDEWFAQPNLKPKIDGADKQLFQAYTESIKKLESELDEYNSMVAYTQPIGGRAALDVMHEKTELDFAEAIDRENFMIVSPEMGHPDYPAAFSDWFGQFAREPIVQIWLKSDRPTDIGQIKNIIESALRADDAVGAKMRRSLVDSWRIKQESSTVDGIAALLEKRGKKGMSAERYNVDQIIDVWARALERVVDKPEMLPYLERGNITTRQVISMMKTNRHNQLWAVPMTSAWRTGGRSRPGYWANLPARYYQHVTLPVLGYFSRKTREILMADRVNRYLEGIDIASLKPGELDFYLRMAEDRAAGWVNKSTFTRTSTVFEDLMRNYIPFLNSYRQFWVYWTKMLFRKPLTMAVLSQIPGDLAEAGFNEGQQIGPFHIYLQSLLPFFLQTAPGEEPIEGVIGKGGTPGLVSTKGLYALPNIEPIMATMLGSLFHWQTDESLENSPLFESTARSMAPFSRYGMLTESFGVDLGRLAKDSDQYHSKWYNLQRQYLPRGKVALEESDNLPVPYKWLDKVTHNPDAFIQFALGMVSPVSASFSPEFPATLMTEQGKYFDKLKNESDISAGKYLDKTKYFQYLYEYRYTTDMNRKIELAKEYPWLPNFASSNYSWDVAFGQPFEPDANKTLKSWDEIVKESTQQRLGMFGGIARYRGEPYEYLGDAAKSKLYGKEARRHVKDIRDYARAAALVAADGNKQTAKKLFKQWDMMTSGLVDFINEGTVPTWREMPLMPRWYENALLQDGRPVELWHPGKYFQTLFEIAGSKNDYMASGYTIPPNEAKMAAFQRLVGAGYINPEVQRAIENGPWGMTLKKYQEERNVDWAKHQSDLLTDNYYDIDVNQLEQLTGKKFGNDLMQALIDVQNYYNTYFSGSEEWKKNNPVGSDGYKRGRQAFYAYKDSRFKEVKGGELFIGGAAERLLLNPYITRTHTQLTGPDADRDRKLWKRYMEEAMKGRPNKILCESLKKHFDNHLKDKLEDWDKVNDWIWVIANAKAMRYDMMTSYSDYYEGPGNSVYTKMGQAKVDKLEKMIKEQMISNTIFKSNIKKLFEDNPGTLAFRLLDWYKH